MNPLRNLNGLIFHPRFNVITIQEPKAPKKGLSPYYMERVLIHYLMKLIVEFHFNLHHHLLHRHRCRHRHHDRRLHHLHHRRHHFQSRFRLLFHL